MQRREREVDGGDVALDHELAALPVGAPDRLLDRGDRLLAREDAGEREEARLQHGVDARAEARLAGDAARVDHEEAKVLAR